jgi:hypothetical protein
MTVESSEPRICEFCLADNELRDEIRSRGSAIEKCLICHRIGGRSLPATDSMVRRIFRALVRLNYSEWEYNHHLGGDSLESIVADGSKIFQLPSNASMQDFEDAFLILEDEWYPKTAEEIELGGGYWDGGVLRGLRDQMDYEVDTVLRRGLRENYFELSPIVDRLIGSIQADIAKDITAGTKYFRSRLGVKSRLTKKNFIGMGTGGEKHYLPFSDSDIAPPPIARASEGRFNRAGVSVLYVATDPKTAVAELRPHPGHLASTAEFVSTRPLRVADFSHHDIRNFLSDNRLEDLRRILSFSAVLNLPVQPEHRSLYILTHLFSDRIREAGYEGIFFRSSLGPGCNLACFATDAFQRVPGSEAVVEVRSLSYELLPRKSLPNSYDRDNFESDGDDMISTLFDGLARNV